MTPSIATRSVAVQVRSTRESAKTRSTSTKPATSAVASSPEYDAIRKHSP